VRISLILTVLNEAESLPRLLNSIAAQTRAPDEIVVVDGGSTDATRDVLDTYAKRLPLKILAQPGANISQGRNAAIRAATSDLICSTDAGVRLDEHWIEELVKPLEKDEGGRMKDESISSSFIPHPSRLHLRAVQVSFDVVSGFFVPDPHGAFETALAATTLPALADIRPDKFLPSSRSIAFRKAAWEKVCGYPEWLDYCEDLVFDFALRDADYQFAFAPRAVAHFRPRANLRAFCRQYYQYARGDGKANLWFKRHVIRYLTYLVALPLVIALTIAAPLVALPLWLVAAAFMFFTPYKRLVPMLRGMSFIDKLRALVWVPVIRVAGDLAKMIGYPVGVAWRVRNGTQ
jgi:glycosyltransferase involved in cell wall biosynthesis